MIAEAGHAALWLAAALALTQALFVGGAFTTRWASLESAVRPVAVGQACMASLSLACLILLFWRTDLSAAVVARDAYPPEPALDRLARLWRSDEGAMLSWVAAVGVGGAAFAGFERRLKARTAIAALGAMGVIALGSYAVLLAWRPFARLDPPARIGAGLPDADLAMQSPMIILGSVGLLVGVAVAAGALVARDGGPETARAIRRWVLAGWVLLTLGMTAVAYAAYSATGQGGRWFWNPIENAPLALWLAATVLLHLPRLLRRRRRRDRVGALARLRWPIGVAALLLVTLFTLGLASPVLPVLALALAAGLATASAAPLFGRTLARTPLATWGTAAAHLGASISLAGIACESAFTRHLPVAAHAGDTRAIGPWRVRFVGVEPVSGENYTAIRGIVLAAAPGSGVQRMTPEARTYWRRPTGTRETAAMVTRNLGQFSVALGRQEADGRWRLRLSWKPYVTMIWLGGVLLAVGGALSLFGRWAREQRLHARRAYA